MNGWAFSAFLALGTSATAAQNSMSVIGDGFAHRCYVAAESTTANRTALEACDRALDEEPLTREDRVATHVNRGILYLRKAEVAKPRADFDRALALDPFEPDAWLNRAILTVKYGRREDALPMVEKAIELNSRRPALAYFVRGLLYEDQGNVRAAYRDFQRARELEPTWDQPATELARFQIQRSGN